MRRARAGLLGLFVLTLAGCLNDRPVQNASWYDRFRSGGPTGPDAVFIEYAVIERPAGSAAINRDAWNSIDEQVLSSETRALLSENGLRVGIVGGMLSSDLEGFLANPKSTIGHRQRRLYAGNPAVLTLNGPVPQSEFQMLGVLNGSPTSINLEQAKFALSITPEQAANGRIKLTCVPEVEYQDKKHWTPPGAAGMGWLNNKPVDKFTALAFEANLSPREYLVVGAFHERGPWLGNQLFGGLNGQEKVQRLIVIRTGRATEDESKILPIGRLPNGDGIVPIASQASVSITRGQKP